MFVLMFLVLVLLAMIPFLLFGAEIPDWMLWPIGILAALLTVGIVVGMATEKQKDEKRKAIVKAAELKRAQRELENG